MAERKTLLLTGASRGIGHATVKYFNAAGWRVFTASRQSWASECPWADGEENHIHLDLEDIPGVEASLELIREKLGDGRLHALVDNAGISPKGEGGERLGVLETVILSVDPERERISLGIKQLEDDPFSNYASLHEKGSIVRGTVKEVDAKGAVISLGDDIEGILKASEISRDRVEDARNVLKEGEEVEAKIISIDRKSRVISLSVKSKDVDDEKDAMKELRKQEVESAGPTTIGDLIRAQMENQG